MANRHVQRGSTLVIKREMQTKITMTFHPKSVRMATIKKVQIINVREDVENRELLYSFYENVKWYSHYVKQHKVSLKKKKNKIATSTGSSISTPGLILEKHTHTHTNTNLKTYVHHNVHSCTT